MTDHTKVRSYTRRRGRSPVRNRIRASSIAKTADEVANVDGHKAGEFTANAAARTADEWIAHLNTQLAEIDVPWNVVLADFIDAVRAEALAWMRQRCRQVVQVERSWTQDWKTQQTMALQHILAEIDRIPLIVRRHL